VTITATSGTVSGNSNLTVNPAEVTAIAVSPANTSVKVGLTKQFAATATYTDKSTKDVTSSVNWTSSDPLIVSISEAGLATGLGTGNVTITAASGTITDHTGLAVDPAVLTAIRLSASSTTVPLGASQQIVATGSFDNETTAPITDATWVSSNPDVISVDEHGVATAKTSSGSAEITATSGSVVSAKLVLTADNAAPKSVFSYPSDPTIAVFQWLKPYVYLVYTDDSVQDVTPHALLSVENTSVANLTSSHAGTITGTTEGATKLNASYEGLTTSTNVTVSGRLTSIAITPDSATVHQGGEVLFTAAGTFTTGTTQSPLRFVYWSSGDLAIATFTPGQGGLVNGLSAGTVTIKGADHNPGTIFDNADVTVDSFSLQSFSLNESTLNMAVNVTYPLVATGSFSDGSTTETQVLKNVTWESSDKTVATVNSDGLVRSLAPGTATITATLPGGSQQTVTVNVAHGTMDRLELTPTTGSLKPGESVQLTGTVYLTDGRQYNVNPVSIWYSSDVDVALVDATGKVTALNPGTATIRMHFGRDVTATITVAP